MANDVLQSGPVATCEQPGCGQSMPVIGLGDALFSFTEKNGQRAKIFFCSGVCFDQWHNDHTTSGEE